MRKIILLFFALSTVSLFSQESEELYGKLNYTVVPHNVLTGIGYGAGYAWHLDNPISWKVEMGMMTSYRERKMDETYGNIRYRDLYYNLAQLNLAVIPTWNVINLTL
ncbi:MAG: hypothetical protein ACK5KP_07435 [Paludibacteraceae bacterium]